MELSGASGSAGSAAEAAELPDDELVFEGLKAFEAAKSLLALHEGSEGRDFTTKIRGGESEIAASGKLFNAVQGISRTLLAKDFCRRRGVQSTFRVGFTKDHSADDPGTLCREWVRENAMVFRHRGGEPAARALGLHECTPRGIQ